MIVSLCYFYRFSTLLYSLFGRFNLLVLYLIGFDEVVGKFLVEFCFFQIASSWHKVVALVKLHFWYRSIVTHPNGRNSIDSNEIESSKSNLTTQVFTIFALFISVLSIPTIFTHSKCLYLHFALVQFSPVFSIFGRLFCSRFYWGVFTLNKI